MSPTLQSGIQTAYTYAPAWKRWLLRRLLPGAFTDQ